MKITTYLIAVRSQTSGQLLPAIKNPETGDYPLCFTEQYAHHMFSFAEKRIICDAGDEILLLKGHVQISNIGQETNFSLGFLSFLQSQTDLTDWDVLAEKKAIPASSEQYRSRVMHDLRRSHAQLLQLKSLRMLDMPTAFQN